MTDTTKPKGVSPFMWLKHLTAQHKLIDGVTASYDFVDDTVHLSCGGVGYVSVRHDEHLTILPALEYDNYARTDSTLMRILNELLVPIGEAPKRGYAAPWSLVFQQRLMTRYTPGGVGYPASPKTVLVWHHDEFWSPRYTPWGTSELVYTVSREMEDRYHGLIHELFNRVTLLADFVETGASDVRGDDVHRRLAELLIERESPTQEDVVMLCRWHRRAGDDMARWVSLYDALRRRLEVVFECCAKMGGLKAKALPAADVWRRLRAGDNWIFYEDEE